MALKIYAIEMSASRTRKSTADGTRRFTGYDFKSVFFLVDEDQGRYDAYMWGGRVARNIESRLKHAINSRFTEGLIEGRTKSGLRNLYKKYMSWHGEAIKVSA